MDKPYKIIFYDEPQSAAANENRAPAEVNYTPGNIPRTETAGSPSSYATKQEIEEIIESKINNLKVYVLESDITEAQNSVRSVIELASF